MSSLVKKLRLQTCATALFLNVPDGFIKSLDDIPENIRISTTAGEKLDFVLLFVENRKLFDEYIQAAIRAVDFDGLMWIAYPKKSAKINSDLSRDILWELMEVTELRPVHIISIDKNWSAIRFRPVELVGKN